MSTRPGIRQGIAIGSRQQQRLRLTPQVRQTIAMLSLPLTELRLRVEQELRENPALEEIPAGEEAEEEAVASDQENEEALEFEEETERNHVEELEPGSYFEEARDALGSFAS